MDAESFERWVNDLSMEYKDANRVTDIGQVSAINGFVGWLTTKYHLEMDMIAQEKFAEPVCCGGTCKEGAHDNL